MTDMSRIILHKPPYPKPSKDGNQRDGELIRRDQSFCSVCCNLFSGSACAMLPRLDISVEDSLGSMHVQTLKAEGCYDETEPVPAWAGDSRLDYAPWMFTARLDDIESEVGRGCGSCSLLHQAFQQLRVSQYKKKDLVLEARITMCKGDRLIADIRMAGDDDVDIFSDTIEAADTYWVTRYEIFTEHGQPCPWLTIGCFLRMNSNIGEKNSNNGGPSRRVINLDINSYTDLISAWLRHCDTYHPQCKIADHNVTLPKRLVYVGQDNTDIYLIEPNSPQQQSDSRYVALSHCWGLTQHLETKTTNIEDWKKSIPWIKLSKTFQEAISLTRSLGVQYIWIDSLCIVQDSRQDWEIEAKKMGQIYHSAFLVVCATASANGDGGLFYERKPCVTMQIEDQDGQMSTIFARETLDHSIFDWNMPSASTHRSTRSTSTTSAVISTHPLLSRAWCFQERLLGRAVLHFTRDEIIFDCLSSVNCECGSMTDFPGSWLRESRFLVHRQQSHVDKRPIERTLGNVSGYLATYSEESDRIFDSWRDMVSTYSSLAITHTCDWLPALAGLCMRMESRTTGAYLAGYWASDLLRGLLWFSVSPETAQDHDYIAPSWSWASLGQQVAFLNASKPHQRREALTRFYVEIDLEKTKCIPKGLNPMGELAAGWLFVTGYVAEFTLTYGHVERDNTIEFFSMDSRHQCLKHTGEIVFGLRFCQEVSTIPARKETGEQRVLILARANNNEVQHLPKESRTSLNVFRRLGIMKNCYKFDSNDFGTLMSMYII